MAENRPNLTAYSLNPDSVHEAYLRDVAANVGYFKENQYLRLGDSDSGHGVFFGTLAPYGEVAIKPFETIGKPIQERSVLEHASQMGFETLEPLDIAGQGLYAYLITRYRPDLRHLGQLDWHDNVASRRITKVITPTLNFAAEFTGKLHSKGITHGDMQVKNFALTREGAPVLADVENGQIKLKGEELVKKGNRDLVRFATSVLRRGLLYDRTARYRLGYLGEEFIEPAIEAEGVPIPAVRDRRREVIDTVANIIMTQAKSKHPAGKAKNVA